MSDQQTRLSPPNHLFPHIITTNDMYSFISRLNQLTNTIYTTQTSDLILNHLTPAEAETIRQLANSKNIQLNQFALDQLDQIQKLLLEIKGAIQTIPIQEIQTSIELSTKTLRQISDWFKQNLDQRVIIKHDINNALIGGATFVINGQYHDYSLKKYLEDSHQ